MHLSQSFQINWKRRRAESFETGCHWAVLNLQIITLLFTFTVQKYTYPPVSKVHAGSFRISVIHRHQTLTCTTGSLTCIRGHQHNIFDSGGGGGLGGGGLIDWLIDCFKSSKPYRLSQRELTNFISSLLEFCGKLSPLCISSFTASYSSPQTSHMRQQHRHIVQASSEVSQQPPCDGAASFLAEGCGCCRVLGGCDCTTQRGKENQRENKPK